MEKEKNKKIRVKAWILLAAVLTAMLIPVKTQYKDGGTAVYRAILYSVTRHHALAVEDHRTGYKTGTTVRVLFWKVYDNVVFEPDNIDTTLSPAGGSA